MKAHNTVTINGKTYDARTGSLVTHTSTKKESSKTSGNKSPATAAHKTKHTAKKIVKKGNGFVDGIARHPKSDHSKNLAVAHKKKVNSPVPAKQTATTARSAHAAKAVHAKPKHSSTLHRSSVKAPSIKAPTVASHSAKKKTSHAPVERVHRAKSTSRSTAITRFGSFGVSSKPMEVEKPSNGASLSMANIAHAAEKARSSSSSQRVKHQLIADSLAAANTHTPPKTSKKQKKVRQSPKIIHFAAVGFAALVLGAYVTYLNVPALSVRVASSRAGFAASYPSQTPSGYGMRGPVAYSPGQVVINFGSNTDDRRFSIQQQPTTWDSAALKENFVAKNTSQEPLTYQDSGLTIYIYNGGDAAWVNDGKFYTVKADNSQLDTKQILDLATSM